MYDFGEYLERLLRVSQQPQHTDELSYHGVLEGLLRAFRSDVTIVHEPARIAVGRPDFALLERGLPIGYVEAEAYATSLDELPARAKAQNEAFRQHLENFLLTNFLEFRLYRRGEEVLRGQLPRPSLQGRVRVSAQQAAECQKVLEAFLTYTPQPVAEAGELARQLARRARLLKAVVEQSLSIQLEQPPDRPLELRNLYYALQRTLIPDLKPSEFADLYAQTMVYGLFAAACYAEPGRFSRDAAARLIPDTIPFLRRLLSTLTRDTLEAELEWLVEDIAALLARADMAGILQDFGRRQGREDPVVHFYEDFLAAYDPDLREVRGVYYTPEPVVQFIVRAVDEVLRKEFGMQGLMDEKALVLDPACGTGSFLYELVQYVHQKVCQKLGAGQWPDYARERLLPRLFGFELLMAPYTIAHLKLTLELRHLQTAPTERLRIYLTNALEPALKPSELLLGEFLTREAEEAATIKRDQPILVVLGNPPYSGHSANRSHEKIQEIIRGRLRTRTQPSWIGKLIEDYKQVDDQPLSEKNPKWLQDDYVKFIRFAQWRIEKTGQGIVTFITNHAYLDNPTFRGMRAHLLRTFQRLYIVNLHGNARRQERAPDGSPDENVFDIRQGVAVLIAIRQPGGSWEGAPVWYCDVWGSREAKYAFLREAELSAVEWTYLEPRPPFYFFVPQDCTREAEYLQGWRIPDIFPVHSVGIVTARDRLTIHRTRKEVWDTVCKVVSLDPEVARELFQLGKDVRDWAVARAQQDLRLAGVPHPSAQEKGIISILYRPFDIRYTFYTGKSHGFHCSPRPEVMYHLLSGENIALITTRNQSQHEPYWSKVFVTAIPNEGHFASDINYTFPLYLYDRARGEREGFLPAARRVNLSQSYLEALRGVLGGEPEPEAVLGYLYAVLYSPAYRRRYAEFLRRDFPRVPLPPDRSAFEQLSGLGRELIELHLLRHSGLETPTCRYPVAGRNEVEKVEYRQESEAVWINKEQYFAPVPPAVWAYRIGGYPACANWLKERRGAVLSFEERATFQKIVTALGRTLELQEEIDKVVREVWGW